MSEAARLAIEHWDDFSEDEKLKIIRKMSAQPEKNVMWQDFLRDQPIESLTRWSKAVRPMTENPLGANGRMFVKNFVTDPDLAIKELIKDNPDIENIRWRDGRIVGNKPGEEFDRVLDPELGEWSDTWNDITDAAYSTLEVVAPAIVQGATTLKTGSPTAGAVTGGLTASGLDAIKQFVAGAPPEESDPYGEHEFNTTRGIDPAQVATAGAVHAGTAAIGPAIRKSGGFVKGMGKVAGGMVPGMNTARMVAEMVAKKNVPKEAGKAAIPDLYDFRGNLIPKPTPAYPVKNIWQDMLIAGGVGPARVGFGSPSLEPPSGSGPGIRPVTD